MGSTIVVAQRGSD